MFGKCWYWLFNMYFSPFSLLFQLFMMLNNRKSIHLEFGVIGCSLHEMIFFPLLADKTSDPSQTMMRALFCTKSVYWPQSLGISCGLLCSFAPWRRPWLRVPPCPDMMSCVWRAEVMGLSRGPSSCRSLFLYVASLLLLGTTHRTS